MSVTETSLAASGSSDHDASSRKSKSPFLLGVILALIGGAGGFYISWSGMILGHGTQPEKHAEIQMDEGEADLAFIPVDPLVISLGRTAAARHLRFRAELEVVSAHKEEVTMLLPRVIDVLNSYLRALEPSDLEDLAALARLRAQMLRRVQVVVGQGRVNDLLVMEFVLN